MATKNVVRTLNEDTRRIALFVADQASPHAGQLIAQVQLDTDGGPGNSEVVTLIVTGPNQNAGLPTAQDRQDFVAACQLIYDTAKAAAGYV